VNNYYNLQKAVFDKQHELIDYSEHERLVALANAAPTSSRQPLRHLGFSIGAVLIAAGKKIQSVSFNCPDEALILVS
jgi:hypothetical protein